MAVCFSALELAEITGGHWLDSLVVPERVVSVQDDTRALLRGALFVAIAGELTDGHRFLGQAIQAGAAAVCVAKVPDKQIRQMCRRAGVGCLVVADSLVAFQALARAHRCRFPDCRVIAITGSSGKTSTKEMVASILEQKWPGAVLKTQGNTNNHFGVPRNLLGLTSAHRAAVLELGTSSPGEIAWLARLVRPEVGVVCNIGRAHLQGLGSEAGVAREKGSLLKHITPGGTAVFPAETVHGEMLRNLANGVRCVTFGTEDGADVRSTYLGIVDQGYALILEGEGFEKPCRLFWQVGGEHQAGNAAAAAAAAMQVGATAEQVARGLAECRLPGMRMAVVDLDGVVWLNDAYNANPDSARASLRWFAELLEDKGSGAPAVVVLGDMLELGEYASVEHADLLRHACRLLPEATIVGVGPTMAACAIELSLPGFADAASARDYITRLVSGGARVLLKGSRGVRLEQILPEAARR